ncbi:MAG: 16S rRNA (guanine(966)-N(2))-methyltransferase RsmD [Defluviitaleaceae bacterium]|nr:16S rRNA (guanine(966)-N(2))-methyltransferase RsmD [Defluviitaleaceae bacterium]
MRVIAGTARGHKLTAPMGLKTRPTEGRMKEDLFNILMPSISGACFLDLYCGSGAIGIEALSRGAQKAVFVDYAKEAIASTEANLNKTRLRHLAEVIYMPVDQALQKLNGLVFDIVFMDPPYKSNELTPSLALASVFITNHVKEDGIIVLECPVDVKLPAHYDNIGLSIFRHKKYGQKQFVFLKRCDNR